MVVKANTKAFTLIELTVVIAVLSMLAAIVVPHLASQLAGRAHRDFVAGIQRLVVEARETAIERAQTLELAYDEAGGQFYLGIDQAEADDRIATGEVLEEDQDLEAGDQAIRTLDVAEDFVIEELQVDGGTASSIDWRVRFYADGTSDSAGILLLSDGQETSITIDRLAQGTLSDGPLPETDVDRWQAGDNVQRS